MIITQFESLEYYYNFHILNVIIPINIATITPLVKGVTIFRSSSASISPNLKDTRLESA